MTNLAGLCGVDYTDGSAPPAAEPLWTIGPYFLQSGALDAQTTAPQGFHILDGGTKVYVLDTANDSVDYWTLTTPWDITTLSYVSTFSVATEETSPVALRMAPDGTKMFVLGSAGNDVNEYTLSTPYDITTASFVDSFSVATQASTPRGLEFGDNGTKMYVGDITTDTIYQYTLSTGYDVSTASYDSISFSLSGQEDQIRGLRLNPDGTKMFVIGIDGDDVNMLTLSTAYNISTATLRGSFSVVSQDTAPYDVQFKDDGMNMYVVGDTNNDIYQYAL